MLHLTKMMVSFYLSCLASRKTVNSITTQRGAIEVVGVPPNIVFWSEGSTKHFIYFSIEVALSTLKYIFS